MLTRTDMMHPSVVQPRRAFSLVAGDSECCLLWRCCWSLKWAVVARRYPEAVQVIDGRLFDEVHGAEMDGHNRMETKTGKQVCGVFRRKKSNKKTSKHKPYHVEIFLDNPILPANNK